MAGILEEVVQLQQRRSHGEYALGGVTAPQTVAELEEALAGAERTDMDTSSKEAMIIEAREHHQMKMLVERGAYVGHVYKDKGKVYADTAFLNSVSGALPGFEMKHLGFGEFYLQGPGGVSIEFDRMRGKDFPGQSGRSHQVYVRGGDKNLVAKLINKLVKAGKVEVVKKVKIPTPKQMAKKTGMKVRAKRRGKAQNAIYDYLMNIYDDGQRRPWIDVNELSRIPQLSGVHFKNVLSALSSMVKSGLIDKMRGGVGQGDQYRLAESAPARPIAPQEPDGSELPADDQSILTALSEADGGTLAAPKIAEVTGLDKAKVRHQLALMAQANLVSRIAPNADIWRVTHFGEACAKGKGKKRAPKSNKPKRVEPAKVEGIEEAVRPGQYFVIIDTSVPGGKMIDRKLYRGTKEPDKIAAKLMKKGRQVQVIDAAWYNPARAIMKAQGMVGESVVLDESLTDEERFVESLSDDTIDALFEGSIGADAHREIVYVLTEGLDIEEDDARGLVSVIMEKVTRLKKKKASEKYYKPGKSPKEKKRDAKKAEIAARRKKMAGILKDMPPEKRREREVKMAMRVKPGMSRHELAVSKKAAQEKVAKRKGELGPGKKMVFGKVVTVKKTKRKIREFVELTEVGPQSSETPGLPKTSKEAKARIRGILKIVARDVEKKALAKEGWIENFLYSELLTATKAWRKGTYNNLSADQVDKLLARRVVGMFEHAMVGDIVPLQEAAYDVKTKPALSAVMDAAGGDLKKLKAAIDKAAKSGATKAELINAVGGTAKWNQTVRALKKAKIVEGTEAITEAKFKKGDIVRRTAKAMRSMGLVSGPINGKVVGYSGRFPLIVWSNDQSGEPMAQAEAGLELDKRAMARRKEDVEVIGEAKDSGGGGYKAQGPLEKMIGEMVRGQSGKWLSKSQMKAIVKVLNKKGITKPSKDAYDDIARIVGKTLSSLMKGESTRPFEEGRGQSDLIRLLTFQVWPVDHAKLLPGGIIALRRNAPKKEMAYFKLDGDTLSKISKQGKVERSVRVKGTDNYKIIEKMMKMVPHWDEPEFDDSYEGGPFKPKYEGLEESTGPLSESVIVGFPIVEIPVEQTTSTPTIVKAVKATLKGRKAARLGRWVMAPPGRVFKFPESHRSTKGVPKDADEYEVAIYGPENFVKAWLKDW